MGISFWHIIIVLLVVLLLFGAGKIPRLMKDLGSGITAFKRGLKDNEAVPGEQAPAATPAASPQIPAATPAAAETKPEEAVRRT